MSLGPSKKYFALVAFLPTLIENAFSGKLINIFSSEISSPAHNTKSYSFSFNKEFTALPLFILTLVISIA